MHKRNALISGLAITLIASGLYLIGNNEMGRFLSSNTTTTPTLSLGAVETLNPRYNPFNAGRNADLPPATLRKSSTEMYVWTGNSDYMFEKHIGNLSDPFATTVWSSPGRMTYNPGIPRTGQYRYRPWLGNVYKHTDGTLIGLVHIETSDIYNKEFCKIINGKEVCDYTPGYLFRQGIAISTDNGDNWKYLGDVIKPQKDAYSNLGGTPLLIVGDYLYQYYNELPLSPADNFHSRIPAVARAPIAEVVAAAKNGTVSSWKKYNNGTWTEDGLTGVGSQILPFLDPYDMHTDAVYSTALGKYLLVAWEQSGYNFATGITNPANRGLYLYTSSDGVNWVKDTSINPGTGNPSYHIYTPRLANEQNPYPFFAGGLSEVGTTDDMNVIGGNLFYLYFPDRENYKLYRIPFTVNNGVVTPPKKIMPLGDSITQANGPSGAHPGFPGGYRKRLGELLTAAGINYDFVGSSTVNPAPGIDPDHNGYPGYRTDQILSNLPSWLSISNPDIVLLHIGTNDLLQHYSTEYAINNLRQIVRQIVSNSSRKIYIAKIVPILKSWEIPPTYPNHPEYATPAYWKPFVDEYNQAVQNMLLENEFKNNSNIALVDMTGSVTDPSTGEACTIMLCETFDGLHPAQKGLNRMGILWYNAITGNTPPVITPPIPVITSPTVDQVFPSNTSTINLEWNTVSEASGYHLRVIEYTDATKTTQTTRRYAGNTNNTSPFYVYIDNKTGTSLTSLPVDPGRHYRFWIHSVINGVVSDGKEVFFSVNLSSVMVPKVLTTNVVGQGTITSTPAGINCGTGCTKSYSSNESIALSASATPGHAFTGWSGACSGTGSCSVSMTDNRAVTATFTPITYTLTTSIVGQGNITGNSSPFTAGTTATITANPTTGYSFTNWSGDCAGINPICTLSMNSNKNTTATFTAIPTARVCRPWN